MASVFNYSIIRSACSHSSTLILSTFILILFTVAPVLLISIGLQILSRPGSGYFFAVIVYYSYNIKLFKMGRLRQDRR